MTSRSGLAVVAALLAACSGPADSVATTVSDVATTTGATASTEVSTTTVPGAPTTTTTVAGTTTTGPVPVGAPTGILVAGEAGIELVVDGTATTILDVPASIAADDLMGGIIFQRLEADDGFGAPEDTIVWWLPAGAAEAQALLVPSGDDRLRLVGVEAIDSSPTVVYIRRTNPNDFETAEDTLRLYDVASAGVSEVRTVGGWESGVGGLTYGGGIFAANWFGEAYSGFDFFDAEGRDVDVAADPYPTDAICFDGTIEPGGGRCFDNVAISADGDLLGYTVVVADDGGIARRLDLVIVRVGDGTERARITLRDQEPFSAGPLDLLGDLVLVGTGVEGGNAMLVDMASETVTSLDTRGAARFALTLTGG